MNLIPLPAFSDNYIWLLHHEGRALVVDPGEAAPVTQWLQENRLQLDCILVTHHHGDHTGGVASLQAKWNAKVYGPALENLPFSFHRLQQGDRVTWSGIDFQTLEVPGHTAGHIAFWAHPPNKTPCFFVAIPCSLAVVADCLKERLHKCFAHWISSLSYRPELACVVPTNTP